jgi:D-inositol-3-phosphate glycosyltransferase
VRIAMVSEHASPLASLGGADAGGQNVHVAALGEALVDRGHQVTVFTRRDHPGLAPTVTVRPGLRVVHIDAGPPAPVPKDELLPYMGRFGEALGRAFRAGAFGAGCPDVVHGHFWMSGLAALAAARPLGIPVVQTFHALGVVKRRHQGPADTSPPERIRLESRVAGEIDRIVATCSDEVFELARLGVPPGRMSVVPCGVDVSRFRPDGAAAPRTRRPRLLAVGRLVPRKGIDDVIRVLPAVPGAELVVAGGSAGGADPEAERLRSVAAGCGVGDRVHLVGPVPRAAMPALYRSADLTVAAPLYEPFGIVPLESMACGVPVVVSAVGGLVDTVVDGVTGRLVPSRRPAELAAVIGELLAHPAARARLGRAGVERARARYTWPRVAAATEAVYLDLVTAGHSTAVGAQR